MIPRQREPVPTALRAALGRDFAPVAPLSPPWRRALLLAIPTLILVGTATAILPPRGPISASSLSGAGFSVLEWLVGLALVWLALREAVPGLGVGTGRALAALGGGIGLQIALGFALWQRSGANLGGPYAATHGAACAAMEGAIGMPSLAVAVWLALRALPLRPRWSGALAGAAAGLLADSLWHLVCVRYDLEHLLVWHFSATLALTLLGAAWGSFRSRRALAA